jgi:hypothetical protein
MATEFTGFLHNRPCGNSTRGLIAAEKQPTRAFIGMQGKELLSLLHFRLRCRLCMGRGKGYACQRSSIPKRRYDMCAGLVNMELYFSASLLGALAEKSRSFATLHSRGLSR